MKDSFCFSSLLAARSSWLTANNSSINLSPLDIEQLQEYCLHKSDTEETLPFGPDTLVFKVNGKIFLLAGLDSHPLQFNVKCNPDTAIELREQYPHCILPGYHMNKKHWNTIIIEGTLSNKQLQSFIDDSYHLVSPKKK